jgi:hypothetical protein
MAPTLPANEPLAGGSRSAIARCVATWYQSMRSASVGGFHGVATFSRAMGQTWQRYFGYERATRRTHSFSFPFTWVPICKRSHFDL